MTEHLIHIKGLDRLLLAWEKPNRLLASSVTAILERFFTPEKAVGIVHEISTTVLGGSRQDSLESVPQELRDVAQKEAGHFVARGLANQVLKWMNEERYDKVKNLCLMVARKEQQE